MKYERLYKKLAPFFKRLYRLEIVGQENIPEAGGLIVAANHTAMMDVIILSVALGGRQVRFMAKKELFGIPLLSSLIRSLGAFPVDRGNADVKSIKSAISIVNGGEVLGIFPQGTRRAGLDPRTTEVKSGVGLIAYRTGACVLPVMIDSHRMKTKMFRPNRIIIGEPIPVDSLGFSSGGKNEYHAASEAVFSHICALKYGALASGEKPLQSGENKEEGGK